MPIDAAGTGASDWVVIAAKIAIILVLSSFMISTAVSFFKVRLPKKERQLRNFTRAFGIDDDSASFFAPAIRDEYSPADYVLPVVFASMVCVIGFGAVMFGVDIIAYHPDKRNLMLTASLLEGSGLKIPDLRWQSMVVLTMAFIGAFVWSCQNIIRRLVSGDLSPNAYYGAGLRMVFAALISLMLSYFLTASPGSPYTRGFLPVVAFLAGMLPEQALLYLTEKLKIFSFNKKGVSAPLPLTMIEGISTFDRIRLSEVGVEDAQNLAEANLIDLLLKTPFAPGMLIDWISQAKLYVYFKDNVLVLRRAGIRNAFDYHRAGSIADRLNQLAQETGLSELTLRLVHQHIDSDQGVHKLLEFRSILDSLGAPMGLTRSLARGA
jgi:hypothetical protein